jgi:hypothetical protein
LPEEGAKAYQAFTMYRDLPIPERSLQMVSQRLGKNKSLCARWSTQFRWVERANAWDSQQDQIRRTRLAAERDKMLERQLQNCRILSQALMAAPIAFAKRAQTKSDLFASSSATELAKLTHLAARALPRIQHEERTLVARPDEVAKQEQPLVITGAAFMWVQSRCTCGHGWDSHDQSDPAERGSRPQMVCAVDGCGCKHFHDQDENP